MPLINVAQRLTSPDIDQIVKPFREPSASIRRSLLMLLALLWVFVWSRAAPDHFLAGEARAVLPAMIVLVLLSCAWALWTNVSRHAAKAWVDVAGTSIDFLSLAFMFSQAWNVMIPFVALLPLACVTTGARFKPVWFYVSVIASVAIVGFTAPPGYWATRPAVAVLAVVLLGGIPLSFNRVLGGLRRISEQAILARDSQNRFLATMSHELRTPLNAVINCSQLIDTSQMPADQIELMKTMNVSAIALRHRVNEVLDVASINFGRIHLNTKPVSLVDVLKTVQAVCTNLAAVKGVTITSSVETQRDLYILGDEGRIEQVITNLVTNAIKFTPSGGEVKLSIVAVPSEESWKVAVTVTDTGIGVPDQMKSQIFAPFTQLSTGFSRTEGGVGLGLFIALSVSDAMGGKIVISDNPGGGSVFRWEFTAATAVVESSRLLDLRDAIKEHTETVQPMHCLVFEDMDTNRLVIESLLAQAGHRVTFHFDGLNAVDRIRAASPDLVLLDLHMPGTSGWEALREAGDTIDTLPPIIVLTADTRSDSIRQATSAGVSAYLAKPINAHELLATIKEHAGLARR